LILRRLHSLLRAVVEDHTGQEMVLLGLSLDLDLDLHTAVRLLGRKRLDWEQAGTVKGME
jgi:hypothetical protein